MIPQGERTRLAGRLGVMGKRTREVQDAPWIFDRAPGRPQLPSAEMRKAVPGAGLKAIDRGSTWDTWSLRCVSGFKVKRSFIATGYRRSGFQKRGPSRSHEFRSRQPESEFLVERAREAKHPLIT